MKNDILEVQDLTVTFKTKGRKRLQAVSNVSFTITGGETLGLVGESGCGKSTIARTIMQFLRPTSGRILFKGAGLDQVDLARLDKKGLRRLRPRFQMVFQDTVSSLNPRRTIFDTLTAPLKVIGIANPEERRQRAVQMLITVGIDPVYLHLRPFQLSGGQCQRIQIARALMAAPELLICDEPVSSLDVSVQAQIINLLETLRNTHGLTMLFISHDLAVVKHICDRILVMYLGRLCEEAPAEKLYRTHYHPYTSALVSAVPTLDPGRRHPRERRLAATLPTPADPPSGCRFRTRCPKADTLCAQKKPIFSEIAPGHKVACHFPIL